MANSPGAAQIGGAFRRAAAAEPDLRRRPSTKRKPIDRDRLTRIDKLIAEMLRLVDRQQAIVLTLRANGQDAAPAEELLDVLLDGIDALRAARQAVLRWSRR